MNISLVSMPMEASSLAAVKAPEPVETGAVTQTESRVTPSATWWISPPGQFFSVLHEVSQQYPLELHAAVMALVQGAAPDGQGMAVVASEIGHAAQPLQRRLRYGATQAAVVPVASQVAGQAHAASPVEAMVATMRTLASERPAAFQAMASDVASSFESVAEGASGPGADAMSMLAMQLQQSAQMGVRGPPPVPPWQRAGPEPVASVPPIALALQKEDDEEAPSWTRTPSAHPVR